MNVKKIVMSGVLVLGISHCNVMAEAIKLDPYRVDCKKNNSKNVRDNHVDRKKVCLFGAGMQGNFKKLSIKQVSNPCFFIDKEDWELDKGRKVNSNTIEFDAGVDVNINENDSFDDKTRPSLGHNLVFNSNGKITNKLDGREVIQVLGTDIKCYLRPTVEEWTFYNGKDRSELKEVGRVKFYLK